MKRLFRELWAELAPHFGAREWFLSLGTLCVVVVWLYFGSPQFFMRTWGAALAGEPWLDWFQYLYYHVCALLLLGVLPLSVMAFGFGIKPSALGIRLGDWRWGLKAFLLGAAIMTPSIYVSSFDPQFQAEYPLTKLAGQNLTTWVLWELTYLIYYLGWEAYFRGALLFGLRDRMGVAGALAFQTAISALVHLGAGHAKPFGETFSAIPAGFLFGAIALRTGSALWPLLIHYYVGILNDVLSFLHATARP